jgi:predicted TIM-barrel fold metal-dependent hydrolase
VGAGLFALPSLSAATSLIIDTHVHFYDPSRPQGVPWPPKSDTLLYKPVLPSTYAQLVRPLGVTGVIVIEASPWPEDNQWLLDLARESKIICGVVGHLQPGTGSFRHELARYARNPLFRGIRLGGASIANGIAQPAFLEDLRRLADAGLMMDAIGAGTMLPPLLTLAAAIPTLRLAIDHMPGEPPGWQSTAESRAQMRELAHHSQVFCKVSGVRPHVDGAAALDELWELFGADRVMYGSNWPVSDNVAPYQEILRPVREYVERRGADATAGFFAANSRSCYRWVDSRI